MITAQRGLLNFSPSNVSTAFGLTRYLSRPSIVSSAFRGNLRAMGTRVNGELFRYTSGRFLYNEQRRLEERQVDFDVDALKHAAEQHVGRGKITHLQKLAEGGFNRVLLLTSEDGFQVVAKIPYPITVPKHYTTASEVATTDLLRSKGVPVPRVFGWSSDPTNPVGVEYIIMEKASGIPLETRWFHLTKQERHHLVTSLVEIETKFFGLPFGSFGSIYYRGDVPTDLQQDLYSENTDPTLSSTDERFCIGPITDYMFWYGKRAELGIDRGPWKTPKDYLLSIGKREFEWTKRYGKPRPVRFPHIVNFEGVNSPDSHLHLLDKYIAVAPYLLGGDPLNDMNRPTLRHPDLTPGNIFVCPDTHKISCIIDWQHTTLLPLLLATGHPPMLQSPDNPPPQTLEKPVLPDNYDSLNAERKSKVDELHRRRVLFYLYMVFNGGLNERHLAGMRDPRVLLTQHLAERTEKQWSGDVFSLKGALIRIAENWGHFNECLSEPVACPISFAQSVIDTHYEQEPTWFEMNGLVEYWKSELQGLGDDGWIRTDGYEATLKRNGKLKQYLLNDCDTPAEEQLVRDQWPFQDYEEDLN